MRKSRLPVSNSRPNVSEGYEVTSELPGRQAYYTRGFLPDILLFTQALIFVWFDGTIIDIISTILLTM